MENTFFISDTHFGHENIIRLAKRPFTNVAEMDSAMISNWNSTVPKSGTVYFLGDFSWYDACTTKNILNQLNGTKHLILGNHDENARDAGWSSIQDSVIVKFGKQKIHLYHYPIEEWDGFYRGGLHFHGHVHGKPLTPLKGRLDVGVENINYTPINISEAVKRTCVV